MSDPTWEIAVDTEDNGTFAADLTADTLRAEWSLGFSRPYQSIAQPARATLLLRNADGAYSPERDGALSGFTAGRALRIRSTFGGVTRQHAILWIGAIEPEPGQRGPRLVRVQCEGFLKRAQCYQAEVPIQVGKRADEIIDALLRRTALYPPGFSGYWLLGVAGQGELGTGTRLGDTTIYSDMDEGISVFPYAMDNNARTSSLYAALRLVAESERGRVLADRADRVAFWSRHHFALDTDGDETFEDTMFELDYAFGEGVVNCATVRHNPRQLDDSGTPTLGTIDRAVKVKAGQSRKVTLRFDDGSGERISSTDVIPLVPTTDYTANAEENGSGADYTADVMCSMTANAQSAELTFANNAAVDVYIQPGSKVRGNNKLTDFGQMEVSYQDADSIAAYGRRAQTVGARLLEDPAVAESLARWVVVSRKDARGEAKRVSFRPRRSDALLTAALARTLGDRVTIRETQTGLDADFFIVGERHQLRDGGADYTVAWTLEPAGMQLFWILGQAGHGELGQATRIGY